jgi:hypothetical protein
VNCSLLIYTNNVAIDIYIDISKNTSFTLEGGASLKIYSREQDSSTSRGDKASYWYHKILDPRRLEEEILRVAIQLELTAYDSSYVVLAMKHGLTLVTEDNKLREKAKNLVKAISLDELTTL